MKMKRHSPGLISTEASGAPETMRHHFRRILRTTPSTYRRTFNRAAT
jgi:transcriptional regulator GlxA family with amidase domain